MSDAPPTRRGLLGLGIVGAAIAGLAGHVFAWTRALIPNALYEPPLKRRLGPATEFPKGRTYLADHNVFVVRNTSGVRVMSAVCTHLGCTVGRKGKGFHCPCHGSKFDREGANVAGPAPRPLPWHPVKLRGGALVVDLGREVGPDVVLPLGEDG